MMSGDARGTGLVTIGDKTNVWCLQSGKTEYLDSDYNYDGQVENIDKNDCWLFRIRAKIRKYRNNFIK